MKVATVYLVKQEKRTGERQMLTIDLRCMTCQNVFPISVAHYQAFNFQSLPKMCPACKDRQQRRPDIVLSRTVIWEGTAKLDHSVVALLATASEYRPFTKDKPSRRLTIKGEMYGAEWRGRIDLWSQVWPLAYGMSVQVVHNSVKRQVWVLPEVRTVASSQVETFRRCEPGTAGAIEREEVNEYVVLLPAFSDEENWLVWAVARSKTTLKGFGNQYHSEFSGSPLWFQEISGGVRSGREYGVGRLAVVCDDDPLVVTTRGSVAGRRAYPAEVHEPRLVVE